MTPEYDVAIIGGGIAGFSLAHFLGPHKKLLILEREDAFGYHATGRSAAEFAFRFHTPLVGKLAALSFPFLNIPPAGFCDTPLLKHRGMILIATEEKRARLEEVFDTQSRSTDRLSRLSVEGALLQAPILNPDFFTSAFHDPDCWDIEVETLFQGFQRSAKRHGATAHRNAEVLAAHHANGLWELDTRAGQFRARSVVIASGAWADETAAMFGATPLGLSPLNRTVINVELPPGRDWSTMPEVQEIDEDFYMKPDAGKLLLSPADENDGAPCDAQPDELGVAWAMHWVNEVTTLRVARPTHSWAGLRTYARDRAPVIGWDKHVQSVFWLAGQGGFGIQTSPALGRYAADLLLGRPPGGDFSRAEIEQWSMNPSRFRTGQEPSPSSPA
jgi:D-arginine dehydrogenase